MERDALNQQHVTQCYAIALINLVEVYSWWVKLLGST